jgi:hypothetical protein
MEAFKANNNFRLGFSLNRNVKLHDMFLIFFLEPFLLDRFPSRKKNRRRNQGGGGISSVGVFAPGFGGNEKLKGETGKPFFP